MSAPIITVEGLGKRYTLRHRASPRGLLRDRLVRLLESPFRRSAPSEVNEEFWALKDVNFSINQGDVVGIIGRNGAGKSTLLKILSRIVEPTTGRITIHGRVASLLEVGTGFHSELSGRENVFLNGAILGMTRAEIRRKFDEIVAFAEVEKFLDTPVKHYSSGMYVRLAFAVAAHLEPEILIVDEVLAVGDAAFQKKCLGKMRDVAAGEGRTVLFVSHNVVAVQQLCRSAILLEKGKLLLEGKTGAVLQLYTNGRDNASQSTIPPPTADLKELAYVTGASIEGADGQATSTFALGRPWTIRIQFRVARSMPDFVAAVGISTAEGAAVQTAWTEPRALPPGNYEVFFGQDKVILAAGSYIIYAGLSEAGRTFQQLEVGRLDVSADNAVGYFQLPAGVGHVLNSMTVNMGPLSSRH